MSLSCWMAARRIVPRLAHGCTVRSVRTYQSSFCRGGLNSFRDRSNYFIDVTAAIRTRHFSSSSTIRSVVTAAASSDPSSSSSKDLSGNGDDNVFNEERGVFSDMRWIRGRSLDDEISDIYSIEATMDDNDDDDDYDDNDDSKSSSSSNTNLELSNELKKRVFVSGSDGGSGVSFDDFPFHLDEGTRDELILSTILQVAPNQTAATRQHNVIVLTHPEPGAHLYNESLARALANHYQANFLMLDEVPEVNDDSTVLDEDEPSSNGNGSGGGDGGIRVDAPREEPNKSVHVGAVDENTLQSVGSDVEEVSTVTKVDSLKNPETIEADTSAAVSRSEPDNLNSDVDLLVPPRNFPRSIHNMALKAAKDGQLIHQVERRRGQRDHVRMSFPVRDAKGAMQGVMQVVGRNIRPGSGSNSNGGNGKGLLSLGTHMDDVLNRRGANGGRDDEFLRMVQEEHDSHNGLGLTELLNAVGDVSLQTGRPSVVFIRNCESLVTDRTAAMRVSSALADRAARGERILLITSATCTEHLNKRGSTDEQDTMSMMAEASGEDFSEYSESPVTSIVIRNPSENSGARNGAAILAAATATSKWNELLHCGEHELTLRQNHHELARTFLDLNMTHESLSHLRGSFGEESIADPTMLAWWAAAVAYQRSTSSSNYSSADATEVSIILASDVQEALRVYSHSQQSLQLLPKPSHDSPGSADEEDGEDDMRMRVMKSIKRIWGGGGVGGSAAAPHGRGGIRGQKVNIVPNLRDRLRGQNLNRHEKRLLGGLIQPEKMPVGYDDVACLASQKSILHDLITLPIMRPELFIHGLLSKNVSGVLFFGPPGTGKTMLAKAVARESKANFLHVHLSDIEQKFLGESEKAARAVFSLARRISPCVIFLDEVDALLVTREQVSHQPAKVDVINEFMEQWDGLSTSMDNARVIVIGATNRPQALDKAVLRRFPRRLMVDLPDHAGRRQLLELLLKNDRLADDVDLDWLAGETRTFSGSDLKALCMAAALRACNSFVKTEGSSIGTPMEDSKPPFTLSRDDIENSLATVKCSTDPVSVRSLRHWDEKFGEGKSRAKIPWGFDTKPIKPAENTSTMENI